MSDINGLDILARDVGNEYLHGYKVYKNHTISGPESSEEIDGRILIIVLDLYFFKTILDRWHEYILDKLKIIGFRPSKEYPDLCIRDIGNRYEYITFYPDNPLVFSKNPMGVLQGLNTLFPLKDVVRTKFYLR